MEEAPPLAEVTPTNRIAGEERHVSRRRAGIGMLATLKQSEQLERSNISFLFFWYIVAPQHFKADSLTVRRLCWFSQHCFPEKVNGQSARVCWRVSLSHGTSKSAL